jgi:hypothetical protein
LSVGQCAATTSWFEHLLVVGAPRITDKNIRVEFAAGGDADNGRKRISNPANPYILLDIASS